MDFENCIKEVSLLRLTKGDILVVKVPDDISDANFKSLNEHFSKVLERAGGKNVDIPGLFTKEDIHMTVIKGAATRMIRFRKKEW